MAPIDFARTSFSALPLVTETCAPSAFARSMAMVATPPPIPVTSTWSPFFTSPRVTRARYAVSPPRGRAAASGKERCSGIGASRSSGSAIFSAKVPGRGIPRMRKSFPGIRGSSPHESNGRITTFLPTHEGSAPVPTDSTVPAPSAPRMQGSWIFG